MDTLLLGGNSAKPGQSISPPVFLLINRMQYTDKYNAKHRNSLWGGTLATEVYILFKTILERYSTSLQPATAGTWGTLAHTNIQHLKYTNHLSIIYITALFDFSTAGDDRDV